jgi:hypothetical protein
MPVAKGYAIAAGLATNGFPVAASGTLDLATNIPSPGDTVVIGSVTYTFQASLASANDVLVGTDGDESIANLINAVNAGPGEGTVYGTGTTEHPDVNAFAGTSADEMDVEAKVKGTAGNSITTTTTISGATWSNATLTGGLDGGQWRVPVLCGANDGLELKTESITMDSQLINSDGATGVRSRVSGERGNEFHAGDATFDMKYRGLDVLFGLAFGLVADPVQQGGEDAYLHLFQPALDLEGLMGTLVFNKLVSVWEYPSAKINSITITHEAGGLMELSVNVIASSLNRNRYSGTNNFTTVASITVPSERQFAIFEHLQVWMKKNDDAEDWLDTNKVYPNSVSFTLNNNMDGADVTTRYGRTIDQALEDGFFEVTGTIGFSKYEEEKFVEASQTKDIQNIKMEWTGDKVIPGATTVVPKMTLYFPEVQIATASPNMEGPGKLPLSADFTAARALADPVGIPTGYGAYAVSMELTNGRTTNPIASV